MLIGLQLAAHGGPSFDWQDRRSNVQRGRANAGDARALPQPSRHAGMSN